MAGGNILIRKRDGSLFTDAEVEGLVFTINGEVVSASVGGTISWNVGEETVLNVTRTAWTESLEVATVVAGFTISAVE